MKQNKSDILTDLVLAVFRLNGAMINWGDDFSASAGLSSARWQMLGAIALAERPLSAPQIAERMGVTRQGAQKQLNLLAEAGLIELIANPGLALAAACADGRGPSRLPVDRCALAWPCRTGGRALWSRGFGHGA